MTTGLSSFEVCGGRTRAAAARRLLTLAAIALTGSAGAQTGSNADLLFLDTGGGPLSPAFQPGTLNYAQTVPPLQNVLSVWPVQKDPNASVQVRVNGGAWLAVSPGTPLAAGSDHSLALRRDGTVAGWGANHQGQVTVPAAATGIAAIAASSSSSAALKADGTVLAWGWREINPVPAAAFDIVSLAVSGGHVLALKRNGTLVAWGNISYGLTTIPEEVSGGVVAIAAASMHNLALRRDGSVFGWGMGSEGTTSTPAEAQSGVVAIAAGEYHNLALKNDGRVIAWGAGSASSLPPHHGQSIVPAAAASTVVAVAAGFQHSLALKADGSVIAWGRNDDGQSTVPAAAASGVVAIAAGRNHSLALKSNGTVIAWGNNENGKGNIPAAFTGVSRLTAPPAALALPLQPGLNTVEVAVTSADASTTKTWTIQTTRPPAAEIAVFNGNSTAAADERTDNAGTLTFAPVSTGTTGTAREFTILNSGTAVLTGLTVSTAPGGNPGDFNIEPPGHTSLAPGGTATFSVAFAPAAAGLRAAAVRIASNDTDENPFRIALSGTGISPQSADTELSFLATGGEALKPAFDPDILSYTQRGVNSSLPVWPIAAGTGAAIHVRVNGGAWQPVASGSPVSAGNLHTVALTKDGGVMAWGSNTLGQTTLPVAATFGVTTLAAGGYHSLALNADGGVLAWARANNGNQSVVPPAAASGVAAIAAGANRSFALKRNGTLIGWGSSIFGAATVPAGTTDLVAVSTGEGHSLALRRNGSVTAWGYNYSGQTTVPAAALQDVIAIDAGGYHSLALKAGGSVVAWGDNGFGQTNVPAAAASGVVAVRAGKYHNMALKGDGSVIAWGAGTTITGDQEHAGQSIVPPAALSEVTGIAAGDTQSVALKADGSIIAWGGNEAGQATVPAGLAAVIQPTAPPAAVVTGLNGGLNQIEIEVTAQNGSENRTYVITAERVPAPDISVHTGSEPLPENELADNTGTLSLGTVRNGFSSPPQMITLRNTGIADLTGLAVSFAAGGNPGDFSVTPPGTQILAPGATTGFSITFTPAAASVRTATLLISSNDPDETPFEISLRGIAPGNDPSLRFLGVSGGALIPAFSPGITTYGQVTTGSTSELWVVPSDPGARGRIRINGGAWNLMTTGAALAAGQGHALVLARDGSVAAWGAGSADRDIAPDLRQSRVPPAGLSGVVAVAAGNSHSLALKSDGSVIGWGDNSAGQRTIPAAAAADVAAITAGSIFNLALKSNGSVIAWGENSYGQTTVPAGAASGVVAISAGVGHSLALKSGGGIIAWGFNSQGQRDVPPAALSGVASVAAGGYHNLALKRDGSVIAWGSNNYGESSVPASAASGVAAISAGLYTSLALKDDGSVVAWGNNSEGQRVVPAAAGTGVAAIASSGGFHLALKNDGDVLAWGGLAQSTVPAALTGARQTSAPPATQSLLLSPGSNTIEIAITAGDDATTRTHTLNLTRTPVPEIAVFDGDGADSAAERTDNAGLVTFDSVVVNAGGAAQPFTVRNTGTAPLTGLAVTKAAAGNPADFSVSALTPPAVAPGESARFTVTFTPVAAGVRTGTMQLLSNDADENPFEIRVSGTGLSLPSNNADLRHIFVSAGTLAPVFVAGTAGYTLTVPNPASTLTVWPHTTEPNSTVEVSVNGGAFRPATTGVPLAGGGEHSLALRRDGSVAAWGENSKQQSTVPAAAGSGVIAVAAGVRHSLALKSNGSVVAWGDNVDGQTALPVAAQSSVVAIAASDLHSLALRSDGRVIGWGYNHSGQLTIPSAATSGVVAIATGFRHSLALKRDGGVIAWGSVGDSALIVPASAQSGVVAIASGTFHNLALKSDGSVVAWGDNTTGLTNALAGEMPGFVAIAAGGYQSLALRSDGTLFQWGQVVAIPPEAASGVSAIAAGRDHFLALKSDASVVAWGRNVEGQSIVPDRFAGVTQSIGMAASPPLLLNIGTNTVEIRVTAHDGTSAKTYTVNVTRPPAPEISIFNGASTAPADERTDDNGPFVFPRTSAGAADSRVFTIANTGTADLTGISILSTGIHSGDFLVTAPPAGTIPPGGSATFTVTFAPPVKGTRTALLSIVSNDADENPFRIPVEGFATGRDTTLSFLADSAGTLSGVFSSGVLSYTATVPYTTGTLTAWPVPADPDATVEMRINGEPFTVVRGGPSIAAGRQHNAALTVLNGVAAWGSSVAGGITVPLAANGGSLVSAGGNGRSAALKADGGVIMWSPLPVSVFLPDAAKSGVTAIDDGTARTLALKNDGSVLSWRHDGYGQETVPAAASAGVTAIATGLEHALALKADGSVIAWGTNNDGATVVPAAAGSGVVAVAAGNSFSMALRNDGSVIAWGRNNFGQTAVPAAAGSAVVAIAAGGTHALALKSDGRVIAWGDNSKRQTTVPVAATAGIVAISADDAGEHSLALRSDGKVFAWGRSTEGQLSVPASLTAPVHKASPVLPLVIGLNTVEIKVTAQNGTTENSYTLHMTRLGIPEISLHDGPNASAPGLQHAQSQPVDFGRGIQGTPLVRTFTIANPGSAHLTVSSILVPGGFELAPVPVVPASIAAGAALTFQVSLTSLATGTHQGNVTIVSDDSDEPVFTFPVTGEVFIPNPGNTVLRTATTLNRQTGLREQTIRLTNNTTATVPAYDLILRGLPAGVEVYNASEVHTDGSVVVHLLQSMPPFSSQEIILEYYSANRQPVEMNPQITTEVVLTPPDRTANAAGAFAIDRVHLQPGPQILLEFTSTPNRLYRVQYSHDGTVWLDSPTRIRAAGNRTQWLDRGPPQTDRPPAQSASRFYRVQDITP